MKFNKQLVKTKKEDTLFVAVSMGEDSVAMSHFLSQGYQKLCLVHVNHGTPYANKAQASFEKYVPYLNSIRRGEHPITGIVKKNRNTVTEASESDFRDIRYSLFEDALKQSGKASSELVVCHHLGDCVESYLMNCFNGVPEYAPIPTITERTDHCRVVRPFLTTSKKDITRYVKDNNLSDWVVHDPSNDDETYCTRNWVRHNLIPQVESKYKGLETVVRKRVENKRN